MERRSGFCAYMAKGLVCIGWLLHRLHGLPPGATAAARQRRRRRGRGEKPAPKLKTCRHKAKDLRRAVRRRENPCMQQPRVRATELGDSSAALTKIATLDSYVKWLYRAATLIIAAHM